MPTIIKPTRTFTDELLRHYRLQGDAPADAAITAVVDQHGKDELRNLMRWLADPQDLSLDRQPEPVQQFIREFAYLPAWADKRKMKQGLAFFWKHAGAVALSLGCYSLPYCYLAANGAQVLWMTERIKNDTYRRLQETGEFVFGVMNEKEWTNGAIFTRILKIRLIHAASRWFVLNSGRWNMDWGYPVNQEDMAGTNGAFSYIVIRGLRKANITTSEAEEEAYLHLLNVVGYINGVADELLPQNLREAFHLDRIIAQRQFEASEAGQGLTKALLRALEQQAGSPSAYNLAAAQMRFFLGDALADMLAIPDVPVETRLVTLTTKLPVFTDLLSRSTSATIAKP
ncbi:oxygenase MpaB family protein [Nibrella saemangeumensis]|uniref:Oxygenase MpaB family protein n=1 Tax=Nibrella saemangeumensis TaxID=1084526 RepID=A0ABP8MFF7_9BACT